MVYLDGVGIDRRDGDKIYLAGSVKGIIPSDEICVVFMYPGSSVHQPILSTKSTIQYIYIKNQSGDYNFATNERYIPYENDGWYAVRIIDVVLNCENWTGQRDIALFVVSAPPTTCTQSFTASASIGELPFTPGLYLFEGDIADPNKLIGAWDIPAEVPNLTTGNTYTAYPTIPSSYTKDDFTVPKEVTFTACTGTIDFVYTKTEDTNGGVYTVLIPVVSTNLKAVGWAHLPTGLDVLEVEFLSGSLYLYYDVPEEIFYGLLTAPSKGFYFWLYIRCKTFDCSGGDIPYAYKKLR